MHRTTIGGGKSMVPAFSTSQGWSALTRRESLPTAHIGGTIYNNHRHIPQYSTGWTIKIKTPILNRNKSCNNLHCHRSSGLACFQSIADHKCTCNAENSCVRRGTYRALPLKIHTIILEHNFEQFWGPMTLFFRTKKALRVGEMLEGT